MSDSVIKVQNVSKRYRLGLKEKTSDSIGGALANLLNAPIENFKRLRGLSKFNQTEDESILWALKDVSFDVGQGEVVGLVGKNGAGKSTMLKILSRITLPTQGEIIINGRVSSLLEVGTGFHQELTGRENVYLNGTILGMKRKEIESKFDEIVAFSGISKFIDTPVKRYSSGMLVRLAFSVAAHLEPEIMIIDEVLAVGDVEFQKRCLGKMQDVASHGRTILFVSHNMAAVRTLCNRSVLLEHGQVTYVGDTDEVVRRYMGTNADDMPLDEMTERLGNQKLKFTKIALYDKAGTETNTFMTADSIKIRLDYRINKPVDTRALFLVISFWDVFGNIVARFDTREMKPQFHDLDRDGTFVLDIPAFMIRSGQYNIKLWSSETSVELTDALDSIDKAKTVTIIAGDYWETGSKNFDGSYPIINAKLYNETE